jgi:hypothetical protein
MKKLFFGTMLLALVIAGPIPTKAEVDINVSIGLPPPIVFAAPPELIVLPETYVYVSPDVGVDLFFWNGWWWRPYEGRWYRSNYYDRGWVYYRSVPGFYFDVDPGWRGYYRERNWYGHPWNYQRIPHHQIQQNWRGWEKNRYWEKQQTWGVQGYQPRPQRQRQELRQQRQQQYQQRPEVQKQQQLRQERQSPQQPRQPQVRQPRQQPQERVQQPERQGQSPHVRQPKQKSQERVEQQRGQEQRSKAQQLKRPKPKRKPETEEEEKEKEKKDRR